VSTIAGAVSSSKNSQNFFTPVENPWSQSIKTHNLSFSYMLDLDWQVQIGIPFIQSQNLSTAYLGDLATGFAYEVIHEASPSIFHPRGLLFLSTTWPTAAQDPLTNSSWGTGSPTLQTGILLLKVIGEYDLSALASLQQRGDQPLSPTNTIYHGPLWNLRISAGYSPKQWPKIRMGALTGPTIKSPSRQSIGEVTPRQMYWDLTLESNYLLSENTSMGFSYNDQTLTGPAENSSLERSFQFFLRHGLF
jgi:hypothetical protein